MQLILVLHIIAVIMWIGSLVVQSILFLQSSKNGKLGIEQSQIQSIILRNVSVPGLLITFITGVLLILSQGIEYLANPWLLYKLIFVLLILAIDYAILRKIFNVKLVKEGSIEISKYTGLLLFVGTILFLFGGIFFALSKPV